jgi:hypothetical protein
MRFSSEILPLNADQDHINQAPAMTGDRVDKINEEECLVLK